MTPKANQAVDSNDTYEFPYRKPEDLSWWQSFKREIYNKETHAVFGRTAKSWGGILTFYAVFFSALSALFSICMYGLMSTLSPDEPRYQLKESLIGTNPGLGFRPYSGDVEKHGSLIWYNASDEGNVKQWTSVLDKFLEDYHDSKHRENRVICDFDRPPAPGKVCDVSLSDFAPCTKENGYAYNQSAPCIFIKLNRIFNWVPEFYEQPEDLPEDMDEDLKQHIKERPVGERNVVWISCYGENPHDKESLGEVNYYPYRGFPGYYHPFRNTPGYLSPLVAVQFVRPKPHVLINIECRAWAKNIEYKRTLQNREGSVHFELQID
ncbi:UNVERIFIED_CONTAM: hypothetical protein PYX00_006472 [Menopon gallinae]